MASREDRPRIVSAEAWLTPVESVERKDGVVVLRPDVMHVEQLEANDSVSRIRVFGTDPEPEELFISSTGALGLDLTAWVPVLAVVASGIGKDIHFSGRVDRQVVQGALEALSLLHGWFPQKLREVRITADELAEGAASTKGEAALFSGGVDSFYTVWKHQEHLSHLLFVHGLDISNDQAELADTIQQRLSQAADAIGKPLIFARTNIREFADRYVKYVEHYHGSAIASLALAHTPMWGRVYIGSTYAASQQAPLGSHMRLDPLWSSSRCTLVHDGAEANRTEKVRAINTFSPALANLRVCTKNPDGAYNCGRCRKCVTTMVALKVCGQSDDFVTFPAIDYRDVVTSLSDGRPRVWRYQFDNLRAAAAMDKRDMRLEVALLLALGLHSWVRGTRVLRRVGAKAARFVEGVRRS